MNEPTAMQFDPTQQQIEFAVPQEMQKVFETMVNYGTVNINVEQGGRGR